MTGNKKHQICINFLLFFWVWCFTYKTCFQTSVSCNWKSTCEGNSSSLEPSAVFLSSVAMGGMYMCVQRERGSDSWQTGLSVCVCVCVCDREQPVNRLQCVYVLSRVTDSRLWGTSCVELEDGNKAEVFGWSVSWARWLAMLQSGSPTACRTHKHTHANAQIHAWMHTHARSLTDVDLWQLTRIHLS